MRIPVDTELRHIMPGYDPKKAHDYYEQHKHLTGRKKGKIKPEPLPGSHKIKLSAAKVKQRVELQARIQTLEKRLQELQDLIRKKEHEEASDDRKSKAKKERAAKDKDKPKTAAEKSKAARENEKYRDKHKQEIKSKESSGKSGGESAKTKSKSSSETVSDLKALATKVKGQIAVAKQKLAAL